MSNGRTKGTLISKADAVLEKIQSDAEEAVKEGIKQVGLEAMEVMMHHLSGDTITWSGGVFQININTGNLRRHVRMEYPLRGSEYAVGVFNNASYAMDVEEGVDGGERKKRLLGGGKAPKKSKATGRAYKSIPRLEKGSLVGFWTVTEDSHLNDIPARPFAEATEEVMNNRAPALLGEIVARKIKG